MTTNIDIKELSLTIPREDLPLKSDVIIGHRIPEFKYQEDECSWSVHPMNESGNWYKLEINRDDNFTCIDTYSWFDEIENLVKKYKGTLVADCQPEGDDAYYIRIRDGVKKSVKIVEE